MCNAPSHASHPAAPTCRSCRYKISHLWQLPALFAEKEQLGKERVRAFTETQRARSVAGSKPALGGVRNWTDRRCAEWLRHEVNLPEHVPLFMGGAIDGGKLLGLDEPKLKALGIDETDGEIILACLQRLERTNSRNSQRAGSRKSGTEVGNARPAIMTEPDVAL